MGHHKFEYNHLLSPSLNEFKWHLRDEIFQMQTREIKNMKAFFSHMEHIRRGCLFLKHKNCHIERKKLILNRSTFVTITSMIDAQPKTNASKLPGATKQRVTTFIEEDKSIISVDMTKFFGEFTQLVKGLDGKIFNCKLQQMNDSFYFLRCDYDLTGKY
jgi:hypothetical protein